MKDQFAKLLRRVNEIPGVERIRYMTSHPRDMHEDVIKAVAECEQFAKTFISRFNLAAKNFESNEPRLYTRKIFRACSHDQTLCA